jgi:S1-C subfamily serine protease
MKYLDAVVLILLSVFVYAAMTDSNWYEFRHNILGENPRSIAENVESTTEILVINSENPKEMGSGTGVLINSRQILSAAHIFDPKWNNPTIKVKVLGEDIVAKVDNVFIENGEDLAVLTLEKAVPLDPISIDCTPLQYSAEDVYTIGSPYGTEKLIRFGNIARLSPTLYKRAWQQDKTEEEKLEWKKNHKSLNTIDMTAFPGNSGGPVFNKRNNMIGIVSSIMTVINLNGRGYENNHYTFTIKPELVCQVLTDGKYKFMKA